MNNLSDALVSSLSTALFDRPLPCERYAALSAEEWRQLYDRAKTHGVAALVLDALSRLPRDVQMPYPLKMQWIGTTCAVEERYRRQYEAAVALSDLWFDNNIQTLVLKGIALSRYYPIYHHRECGDFDCYLFGKYEQGNRVAARYGAKVNTEWYKHSQIYFRGCMAENHLYFVTTREGRQAKLLNRTLEGMLSDELDRIGQTHLLLPPAEFTALFVTYHSFSHFISEGITLRHLCDWACFMRHEQHAFDWTHFYDLCRRFKFDRFVDVSNSIATKYLGLTIDDPAVVCESPYTDKVLHDILYADSKIYNSVVGKWTTRFKLLTNMFRYGWKYTDIARSSPMHGMWNVIWGFVTRRDQSE